MSFLGGGNVLGPHAPQPITKLAAWGAAWLLSGLAGRSTLQQTSHVYFVMTRADRHPRRPTAVTCLFCCCCSILVASWKALSPSLVRIGFLTQLYPIAQKLIKSPEVFNNPSGYSPTKTSHEQFRPLGWHFSFVFTRLRIFPLWGA